MLGVMRIFIFEIDAAILFLTVFVNYFVRHGKGMIWEFWVVRLTGQMGCP